MLLSMIIITWILLDVKLKIELYLVKCTYNPRLIRDRNMAAGSSKYAGDS